MNRASYSRPWRWAAGWVVLLAAPWCMAEGVEAVARPSDSRTLAFVRPGRIAKVHVKEGDGVKAGDPLVRQDDEAEQAQLEQLKKQADDKTRIEARDAQLNQSKEVLKELKLAATKGATSKLEVAKAALEVTIAELSLKLAEFERDQDISKHREAKIQLARMLLKSPIDGSIEEILVKEGEAADSLQKVIRVIQIDPLEIQAPVPLKETAGLKIGVEARVDFADERGKGVKGEITFVAAEADAASGTLRVTVRVPNPKRLPAGHTVWVHFAENKKTTTTQPVKEE